ncbi:MAG TPA: AAA family ATPase, partial [Xanthobacteraceae bacterium]|nr:AAA family ATPase [Xanthobacteraceae bacterium]
MTPPREPSADATHALLLRIADALERLAPPSLLTPDFEAADAFVWHTQPNRFEPVKRVNRVDME